MLRKRKKDQDLLGRWNIWGKIWECAIEVSEWKSWWVKKQISEVLTDMIKMKLVFIYLFIASELFFIQIVGFWVLIGIFKYP